MKMRDNAIFSGGNPQLFADENPRDVIFNCSQAFSAGLRIRIRFRSDQGVLVGSGTGFQNKMESVSGLKINIQNLSKINVQYLLIKDIGKY